MAPPLSYRDFTVALFNYGADGAYQVRAGDMRPPDAERGRFAPGAGAGPDIPGLVSAVSRRRASLAEMMALGSALADLLLMGRVRTQFEAARTAARDAGQGLRLRLHVAPPPLASLPWELMLLPGPAARLAPADFLALQKAVSITRHEPIGQAANLPPAGEKIRLAMVLASPELGRPLDLEKEERAIASAVAAADEGGRLLQVAALGSLLQETPAAARANLPVVVEGAGIFHFAGHARTRADGTGEILLEDAAGDPEPLPAVELADLLGAAGVRLAVLGACDSGRREGVNHWTGVAPALVGAGIPAVVSMQDSMRDRNAALCAGILYLRLLGGYTIDEAVSEARRAIFRADASNRERDWAIPVLHLGDTSGVLFPLPATAGPDDARLRVRQELGRVAAEDVIGARVQDLLDGSVDVVQRVNRVADRGRATAFAAGRMQGGTANVTQEIEEAASGTTVIGASIGTLGGGPAGRRDPAAETGEPAGSHVPLSPEVMALAAGLSDYFDLAQLNVLAFDLGIKPDNVGGQTLDEKARALALYCAQNGLLDSLRAAARSRRPHVDWG